MFAKIFGGGGGGGKERESIIVVKVSEAKRSHVAT